LQYFAIHTEFIQNSEQQIDELQKLFNELTSGQKKYIYVLLGVVDHFALAKISKTEISYYDSSNISLRDIWNGRSESISEE
jgi:hypothetical protein